MVSKYAYVNDELARRSSVVNSGAAFGGTSNEHLSLWTYNDRNELTGSARREGDDAGNPGDADLPPSTAGPAEP